MDLVLHRQRRPVIEQLAKELCQGNQDGLEQVEGHRVVELLESTALEPVTPDPDVADSSAGRAPALATV